MMPLIQELCAFRTGVVADENADLFARIAQELPLEIFEFDSGDTFNGWLVPENWSVRKAKIWCDGEEIYNGAAHTLGVGYYSRSFSGELSWEELKPHLVTNPSLPEALMFHCMWQYRPWDADWVFSMPYSIYQKLGPGRYHVELETYRREDKMLVAHSHAAGASNKTIVFNSNNCHPHMANDGFAGTVVLIRLMQWLMEQETYYSYRFVLGPEHLGTVFYLRDLPQVDVENMVGGIFEEMPGTDGPLVATSTFLGNHMIDNAFSNVLRHHSKSHELVPWRSGAGNDETVWEAPGYEVPFVELTRREDQFAPYPEYHSSLDTPDLMRSEQLEEMLDILKRVVGVLERNYFITRSFDGLICLSNPDYALYMERPDPTVEKNLEADAEKWGHLLDSIFRYMDGRHSILDIAEKHDVSFDRLYKYLQAFEKKGLVTLTRAEINREVPKRIFSD